MVPCQLRPYLATSFCFGECHAKVVSCNVSCMHILATIPLHAPLANATGTARVGARTRLAREGRARCSDPSFLGWLSGRASERASVKRYLKRESGIVFIFTTPIILFSLLAPQLTPHFRRHQSRASPPPPPSNLDGSSGKSEGREGGSLGS